MSRSLLHPSVVPYIDLVNRHAELEAAKWEIRMEEEVSICELRMRSKWSKFSGDMNSSAEAFIPLPDLVRNSALILSRLVIRVRRKGDSTTRSKSDMCQRRIVGLYPRL